MISRAETDAETLHKIPSLFKSLKIQAFCVLCVCTQKLEIT